MPIDRALQLEPRPSNRLLSSRQVFAHQLAVREMQTAPEDRRRLLALNACC